MSKVRLRCPVCSKNGEFEVHPDLVCKSERGVIAINIACEKVCEHNFTAYIDRNLKVRDYFVADFEVEIPDIKGAESDKFQSNAICEKEFDIDLIKLNLTAPLLTYIVRSMITKQKIVLISDKDFLFNQIRNFFNAITEDSFDIDLTILKPEEYSNNKKKYKSSMVFDGLDIIRNYKKQIKPNNLYLEKIIIRNFLSQLDNNYGFLKLKNEIRKLYLLSEAISEFSKDYAPSETPNKEEPKNSVYNNIVNSMVNQEKYIAEVVSRYLKENYEFKVNKQYLKTLLVIVEKYFETDLSKNITIN